MVFLKRMEHIRLTLKSLTYFKDKVLDSESFITVEKNLKFSPTNEATVTGFGSILHRDPLVKKWDHPNRLQQTEVFIQNDST